VDQEDVETVILYILIYTLSELIDIKKVDVYYFFIYKFSTKNNGYSILCFYSEFSSCFFCFFLHKNEKNKIPDGTERHEKQKFSNDLQRKEQDTFESMYLESKDGNNNLKKL